MKDFNGFGNLMEVQGRDFKMLQKRLMEITVPAQLYHVGTKSTGTFYAIVKLDRPSVKKKAAAKAQDI